jgi:hypothetical protein
MAIAHHLVDAVTGRELALTQLVVQGDDEQSHAARDH